MAKQKRNNYKNNHLEFLRLAFEQAKINLGSTKNNPSVGCVVEREGCVVSSGHTSLNGRPHAEFNALKKKINFKNSNIYVTLEPCSHYGRTPPCTNVIIKKGIKRVYYSVDDLDERSKKKSINILSKNKITTKKFILKKKGLKFYESYFRLKKNKLPFIDAKIALSKDYLTNNKKSKWITNKKSRRLSHLLRSKYNALVSTSKSINKDNSLLNCRISGLSNKSPDLIIIDRNLTIKKSLKIFKKKITRKIYLFTSKNIVKKISWLKKNKVKVIFVKNMKSKRDYNFLFKLLIKKGYSRILVETGLMFTNFLITNKFIDNIYIFKANFKLQRNGFNNTTNRIIKKIKLRNKLRVNLDGDSVYKERLN